MPEPDRGVRASRKDTAVYALAAARESDRDEPMPIGAGLAGSGTFPQLSSVQGAGGWQLPFVQDAVSGMSKDPREPVFFQSPFFFSRY